MDKLTAIKIKMPNGSYSNQILISALAENVKYDGTRSVKDILDLLDARISSIIALEAGSTTGDAELIDLRIGANGKSNYTSAGQAVRSNINKLQELILIQETTPGATSSDGTTSWNKLWINNGAVEEIEIPTKDEFDILLNTLTPVNVLTWQGGDFDVNGTNHTNSKSIRSTNFIPDNIIGIMCSSNYKFCVWAWDKETGDHVGHLKEDGTFGQTSSYKYVTSFALNKTLGYKYKVTFYNENSTTNIATSAGVNCITYRDTTDTMLSLEGVAADAAAVGNVVASVYNAASAYNVGDYVNYNGTIYKCKTAIGSGGETWAVGHWEATSISNEFKNVNQDVTDLKSALDESNELRSIEVEKEVSTGWVKSQFVNTNKTIGAVISIKYISPSNCNCIIIPVQKGDTYLLTGTGDENARLYAWIDTNNVLLSKADASITVTAQTLTAEYDGSLIVNVNKNYNYSLKKKQVIIASESTYSLLDFGAVGDGLTDDTEAIQTALNYCKDVYIPEGTYLFSKTLYIKSGTHLQGVGASSVFQLADTFTLTPYTWREDSELVFDHNRYPMIMIEGTESGCALENFKLRGQTTQFYDKNCEGLSIFGGNHVIKNLIIEKINFFPSNFSGRTNNGVGYGIRVAGKTVSVENCTVNECGYEGIGIEDADTVLIENCNIGYSLQTGLQIHRNCQHIHILNNTINCFNGNSTYRPGLTLHAIDPYVLKDINITGNYIISSVMFANGGSENDVHISNNFLGSINVNDFDTPTLFRKNWIITGNTFTGFVKAKCDNLLIANNIFTKNDAGSNIIEAKSNKYLIENNLAAGTASGIEIVPH